MQGTRRFQEDLIRFHYIVIASQGALTAGKRAVFTGPPSQSILLNSLMEENTQWRPLKLVSSF